MSEYEKVKIFKTRENFGRAVEDFRKEYIDLCKKHGVYIIASGYDPEAEIGQADIDDIQNISNYDVWGLFE